LESKIGRDGWQIGGEVTSGVALPPIDELDLKPL